MSTMRLRLLGTVLALAVLVPPAAVAAQGAPGAAAQKPAPRMPDACALLTRTAIRSTLGFDMDPHPETISGTRCSFQTTALLRPVYVLRIEYTDLGQASSAQGLLKGSWESDQKTVAGANLAHGLFDKVESFTPGGPSAYLMTTAGDTHSGPLTRLQFVLGSYLFTVDTEAIDLKLVKTQAEALFKAIKASSGR